MDELTVVAFYCFSEHCHYYEHPVFLTRVASGLSQYIFFWRSLFQHYVNYSRGRCQYRREGCLVIRSIDGSMAEGSFPVR